MKKLTRRLGVVGLFFILISPLPAQSQDATPIQTIESDDPRVLQVGTWSTQSTPANGSYLYNPSPSPSPFPAPSSDEPLLALAFVGSAIEIIYIAGPQFGTLAIEIDGVVVRTVITTTEKIEYAQSTRVDYLSDEPHSLKVYAQSGGTIAVDAFRILISPSLSLERGPGGEVNVFGDDGGIQSTPCSPPNATHRVSLTATSQQSNGSALTPAISSNGRYISFVTPAQLVPGEDNGLNDVFLYDHQTCDIHLISVSSTGGEANQFSGAPSLSADGRYVAFFSEATNLVPGDTNGFFDVFVRDWRAGQTTRVSVASGGGAQALGGISTGPSLSADGRYVAFSSGATNLAPGDTNGQSDIFVHDRQTGITTRVNVGAGGAQATGGGSSSPSISADGRYISFSSSATNLVTGDTNATQDVFVHDRQTSTTTRVSVATGGAQSTGGISGASAISADGRFVTFESVATNLVAGDTNGSQDIFVHDRQTNTTTRVNVGAGGAQTTSGASFEPSISADGRYVTFHTSAANLVTGDTNATQDVFVHDRQTATTTRVSLTATDAQATGGASFTSVISTDGQTIVFVSAATNLVAGDTNGHNDIFVTPRLQHATDTLALFNPTFEQVNLLDTLGDNPVTDHYTAFSVYPPITPPGQWVMGDWNGDGLKTPGVYANGPFYYTNQSGESQTNDWRSLWIGVPGIPVSGRFNGALPNDCIGAVQQASSGGSTVFVLYFTCQLDGTPAPPISNQWLSAVLPDSGGFSGVHQFGAGDFNGDGVDSIAVRRGTFIAFGNVAPTSGPAAFDLAQFIGTPQAGADAGIFVVGNWDNDPFDSFGLFYQNGEFFFRNDLLFNSGAFGNQSIGTPFGNSGVQATTWR